MHGFISNDFNICNRLLITEFITSAVAVLIKLNVFLAESLPELTKKEKQKSVSLKMVKLVAEMILRLRIDV